jgi:hypothetical protein
MDLQLIFFVDVQTFLFTDYFPQVVWRSGWKNVWAAYSTSREAFSREKGKAC